MNNSTRGRFFVLFGIVFLSSAVFSQPVSHQSTLFAGQTYAVLPFLDGFPEFPPVARRIAANRQYATIRLADSMGTVYICTGKDAEGEPIYYLLHHRQDGTWKLSSLNLGEGLDDTLRTTFDLDPFTDRQTVYPMDLRISPARHTLLFRWFLSENFQGIPEGVPTPASQLLDVGKTLFDFTVTDLAGRQIRSPELRGKITVVNWWATWCTACIAEMAGFNKLVHKYQPQVDFVAVACHTPSEIKVFLGKHEFLFRQTVTSDSVFRLIGSGIPRTVVLDEQGVVRFDRAGGGPDSYKEFEKEIDALLAKHQRNK